MLNKSTSGGKSAKNVTRVLSFCLQHLAVGSRTAAGISVGLLLCLFCDRFCGTGIGSRVENFSKVSPGRLSSSNFRLEHRERLNIKLQLLDMPNMLNCVNQYLCRRKFNNFSAEQLFQDGATSTILWRQVFEYHVESNHQQQTNIAVSLCLLDACSMKQQPSFQGVWRLTCPQLKMDMGLQPFKPFRLWQVQN